MLKTNIFFPGCLRSCWNLILNTFLINKFCAGHFNSNGWGPWAGTKPQAFRDAENNKTEKERKRRWYSLLTFMLPKEEGCGTGLQLSAKEVVLGRPDIFPPQRPPSPAAILVKFVSFFKLRNSPEEPWPSGVPGSGQFLKMDWKREKQLWGPFSPSFPHSFPSLYFNSRPPLGLSNHPTIALGSTSSSQPQ